jgi:hypothetical protein
MMDEAEYADLLQHTREQVRLRGRADLDLRALERGVDRQGARERLLGYLEALREEIVLGSSSGLRSAMEVFRTIETDRGLPIRGIVVEVEPQDQPSYGTDRIDLVGSPELDDLLAELDELLAEFSEDEEG